jgi:CheY-like chemotaxis protein
MHPRLSSYHDDADMLEVAITDNGTGIKEEDISRLFEMFGKIKETREINTHGIGLGLHIC